MAVKVIEVSSNREKHAFDTFPGIIYRGYYRAPCFPLLDRSSPRFDRMFESIEAQPFLAFKNGRLAGRVAAARFISDPGAGQSYFGYFESVRDLEVSYALLQAAKAWLAERGGGPVTGPVDLSPHERLGLLAEGFAGCHQPGMPFNPPYYEDLLLKSGLVPEMDLYSYYYDLRRPLPERLSRAAARAGRMPGLCLRQIDFNRLQAEGEVFSTIHNQSMKGIWGFVPLSAAEAAANWLRLRNKFDPALILVAEVSSEPAGLLLILCPLARALSLAGVSARLAVLAIPPRYRFKGLESALLLEGARRARRRGITTVELSLVAASNAMMVGMAGKIGAVKARTYRVYKY